MVGSGARISSCISVRGEVKEERGGEGRRGEERGGEGRRGEEERGGGVRAGGKMPVKTLQFHCPYTIAIVHTLSYG